MGIVIPSHLEQYCVEQGYDKYSSRDHAVWRFIMRQAGHFLEKNAHPIYLSGLRDTGISREQIPRITEIDKKLQAFGWGATCVQGFIPPLAFLEFLSHKILPIAADMRTIEHIDYTPAPDIVHEAAGHAPILADPGYRAYLQKYARVARKAIFSHEDLRLYEAIRVLSDLKENHDATTEQIAAAEAELSRVTAELGPSSEAGQLARMFWWTVEYGLLGSLDEPLIYGAGLLSSLSEARDLYGDGVKKLPFGLACVEQAYDITKPQPQLFVARDIAELSEVLERFESKLAFKIGGGEALERAVQACQVTTTRLDSGLEISGQLELIEPSANASTPRFLKWRGPVQLCIDGQQLKGHGTKRHPSGFSMPFGAWKGLGPGQDPKDLGAVELASLGIMDGSPVKIDFVSGITVTGTLVETLRNPLTEELVLLTLQGACVYDATQKYFLPEWGEFDLALATAVESVYGGPSDWEVYDAFEFGTISTQPGRISPFTAAELDTFAVYQELRDLRARPLAGSASALQNLAERFLAEFTDEWLIGIEIVELASASNSLDAPWLQAVAKQLGNVEGGGSLGRLIGYGVELARIRGVS